METTPEPVSDKCLQISFWSHLWSQLCFLGSPAGSNSLLVSDLSLQRPAQHPARSKIAPAMKDPSPMPSSIDSI